jgi:hypothetical protein
MISGRMLEYRPPLRDWSVQNSTRAGAGVSERPNADPRCAQHPMVRSSFRFGSQQCNPVQRLQHGDIAGRQMMPGRQNDTQARALPEGGSRYRFD